MTFSQTLKFQLCKSITKTLNQPLDKGFKQASYEMTFQNFSFNQDK